MALYNVHIYREMRLYFPGIEAATLEAAATIAAGKLTPDADEINDCDGETLAALVDVAGDEEYEHSRFIDFEAERLRKAAPRLLDALSLFLEFNDQWLVTIDAQADPEHDRLMQIARAAIAEANGDSPAEPRKPLVIEVRGGVVQDVLNVPPGIEYEIRDYDNLDETN